MQYMTLTLVEVLQGRSERKTHEVMARRVEQVASVRRVDIKEDTRDNDSLMFEKFLKESLKGITPQSATKSPRVRRQNDIPSHCSMGTAASPNSARCRMCW